MGFFASCYPVFKIEMPHKKILSSFFGSSLLVSDIILLFYFDSLWQ